MAKPDELLAKAAEIMSTVGLHRHDFDNGDPVNGPVCLEGAVRRAAYGRSSGGGVAIPFEECDPARVAWEALGKTVRKEVDSLATPPLYNDRPTTTAEDAILTLKRAAESAREWEEETGG